MSTENTREVIYRDHKADAIADFDLLSNFIWRRANYLLQGLVKSNEKITVLDPCAGGGRLLSKANKGFDLEAYEPDYESCWYGVPLLNLMGFNSKYNHGCFESHFAGAFGPSYNLVISIPYTDRQINGKYETNVEYLKIGNYAFYVMSRSMDVLLDNGIGVFCIPKEYQDSKYTPEISKLLNKAAVISMESYGEYAIVVLQRR